MRTAFDKHRERVFHDIYQNSFDQLFHFTRKLLGDHDLAKDVVQQCYTNLWPTAFEQGGLEDARRQLFTFAKNMVIDHRRREVTRIRFLQQLDDGQQKDGAAPLHTKEALQDIEAAIEALPAKRKHIYKLSRNEGLSHEEIAVQLSISKNTVNNQIASANEFLKERLHHLRQ
ncbi:RNA polymerase sigma factor [Dinghuibacter silviterrae]|uniref:RNA polymerase sigma-70 factor (ECF subfamily) n=1 Tax=Dinghuibacter silviterrae TaxID=1539049 RepID=A0A4R8DHM8_9BACT|nr:sigma-70 family RNA polymerase sigma factor [Dinghuibacter silviterrae]TDW97233.1 RNA polymerase sigma-70 factor (ECF subfamily) [Dinghuibacter silviterrae]